MFVMNLNYTQTQEFIGTISFRECVLAKTHLPRTDIDILNFIMNLSLKGLRKSIKAKI